MGLYSDRISMQGPQGCAVLPAFLFPSVPSTPVFALVFQGLLGPRANLCSVLVHGEQGISQSGEEETEGARKLQQDVMEALGQPRPRMPRRRECWARGVYSETSLGR